MKNIHSNFPRYFEIQTASYCNGGCSICPYTDTAPRLPAGFMSMPLFKKIIDQIAAENNWGIKIIPYMNNEPFLDPQIFERLKYINKQCPNCDIEISTNLSRFDKEAQKKLSEVDIKDLRLSIFGFTKKSYESVMRNLKWQTAKRHLDLLVNNRDLRSHIGQVSLVMVDYPGMTKRDIQLASRYCRKHFIKFEFWGFLDRGNNVAKYKNNVFKNKVMGCEQNRVLDRMHILFDGRVILCCMDWRQQYILGNLSRQTINLVWNSKKFQDIRKTIYGGTSDKSLICKRCKLSL